VLKTQMVHAYEALSLQAIQTLFTALRKSGAVIKLNGTMTLSIGENTEVTVDYYENSVPVFLELAAKETTPIV